MVSVDLARELEQVTYAVASRLRAERVVSLRRRALFARTHGLS